MSSQELQQYADVSLKSRNIQRTAFSQEGSVTLRFEVITVNPINRKLFWLNLFLHVSCRFKSLDPIRLNVLNYNLHYLESFVKQRDLKP